ncbi:N-acetylmuramoyl-L-alanine amidase family protein [Croceicoccus gelatinilyticus]|uniref:N-acetylmuramoyl-L-alanine amidase family protein n=1 Tax=Croceicoccus gelatinilyticus TaxID=2835536 RepID=UPI001BCCEF8E|nr:N-acetylmuramoyl-L-alanine amidase [Croceicoccus gelatinilyticus]MBS7668621.1 N-acetylmuramoyl-L-alanine amidase [Croceicoccus gelatinilyticus]
MGWDGYIGGGNGAEHLGKGRLALVFAGAVIVGAMAGFGFGVVFPGGGDAVISRQLPALQDAELPRIAVSESTGADAPLVVLDPGHGGFDPGASSAEGAREKDIALALAVSVRDVLLDLGGVRVALTRETDRFLPLEERPRLAEALGADAFVSIHADSAPVPEAQGANVYVLSARASDREAQALARIENESASGLDLPDGADDVAQVLADLMRRETALASVGLATSIDEESLGAMPRHEPFRRSANFVVLRSPELPSVLFEAGYLTNPEDAARLSDPATRQAVAEALARAILTDLLASQPR